MLGSACAHIVDEREIITLWATFYASHIEIPSRERASRSAVFAGSVCAFVPKLPYWPRQQCIHIHARYNRRASTAHNKGIELTEADG